MFELASKSLAGRLLQRCILRISLTTLLTSFLTGSLDFAQAQGDEPAETLIERFQPSAKAIGLGGSLVVQARDASAVFWNPALMSGFFDRQMLFSVNQPFAFDYVGIAQFIPGFGTFGLSWSKDKSGVEDVDRGSLAWGRRLSRALSVGTTLNVQKYSSNWFADVTFGTFIGNAKTGTLENNWRSSSSSHLLDKLSVGAVVRGIPIGNRLFETSLQLGASYLLPGPGLLLNTGYDFNPGQEVSHLGLGFQPYGRINLYAGIEDFDQDRIGAGLGYAHDNFVLDCVYSTATRRFLVTISARISPPPADMAYPYYQKAAKQLQAEQLREATSSYKKYLAYDLRTAEADTAYFRMKVLSERIEREQVLIDSLFRVAGKLLAEGETQYLRAALIFSKILELDPGNLKAKTNLSNLQPYIEQFVKKSLAEGVYDYDQNNYFRARRSFNRVLLFDAENEIALEYLGKVEKTLQDFGEEYFYRGVGFFRQKNYPWAKEEFLRALKYDPEKEEARIYLERTLAKISETQQEVARLVAEGEDLERADQNIQAVNKYLEALALDENNKRAKSRIAVLRPKIERFVESKYSEAQRYMRLQDFNRAQATFNTVLSIDPQHKGAKNGLAKLRNEKKLQISNYLADAEDAAQSENWNGALEIYEKVLRLESANSDAADGKAMAERKLQIDSLLQQARDYFTDGAYPEALNTYDQILQLAVNHPVARVERESSVQRIEELVEKYFNDGINLYTLDRYQEAIVMWEKALKLDPKHQGSLDYKKQAEERIEALKKLK